jgi:hypothetical protein
VMAGGRSAAARARGVPTPTRYDRAAAACFASGPVTTGTTGPSMPMIFSFLAGRTRPSRKADHRRSRRIMPSPRPDPPPWRFMLFAEDIRVQVRGARLDVTWEEVVHWDGETPTISLEF